MFLVLSVIMSRGGGGLHMTITHDALDLTIQIPLVVTSGGY